MKTVFLLAALMICGFSEVHGKLEQFQEMTEELTGKYVMADYMTYGCNCGWKNFGAPVDETDWCCVKQKCCYLKLQKEGCSINIYPYKYKINGQYITCGTSARCKDKECACDVETAKCFLKNLESFQVKYRQFPISMCNGEKIKC
ncbi:phospholipase A2, membrane associated-like [Macrotis lagotis]|uniref:phospholipase A2, membrane associated-like n=1 Tax=Macrotis lagotis TaxID=92651 RepID=UPI003D6999B8